MYEKSRRWVTQHWVLGCLTAISFIFFALLYMYRLGSFVRGDSAYETIQFLQINGIDNIWRHIALGPIKLAELVMVKIDQPNSTLLRIVSFISVMVGIYIFYRLISKWHSSLVAILATILLVTSSYSLHLGRFTTQDAMYYSVVPLLILIGTWLKSKRYVKRLRIALPIIAVLVFIPGVLVFIPVLFIVFKKRLLLAWTFINYREKVVSIAVAFVIIAPIIFSLILYPSQITEFLGFDRISNEGISGFLHHLFAIPNELFYHGPSDAYRWLAGTPILDIGSIVLLALGIYAYFRGTRTLRARLLLILAGVCALIIGSSSVTTIALFLPLVYIVIANGISYLLQMWYTIFPRNPAAQNTAIVIVCLFVALISTYHIERYFVAWPNDPATRQSLSQSVEEVLQ